jgi:hypothetical protein
MGLSQGIISSGLRYVSSSRFFGAVSRSLPSMLFELEGGSPADLRFRRDRTGFHKTASPFSAIGVDFHRFHQQFGQALRDLFLVELSFAKAGAISAAQQPERKLRMNREIRIIGAPRIQVVLSLADEAKMTAAGTRGPFYAWLILDLPDGKPAATIPLAGGPFVQDEAMLLMETIWTSIGEKFAKPETLRGTMGLERNRQ